MILLNTEVVFREEVKNLEKNPQIVDWSPKEDW